MQMWDKVKQFLAAPVFADDEEKTRIAALLNPMLLSLFVADIFGALATVFVFAQKLGSGIGVVLIFIAAVVAKLWLQRGRVRAAGILFVVGVGLPLLTIFLLSDQRSFSGMTLLSLTVVAGLILGWQAAWIVAVLSSLLSLAALIAARLGYGLPVVFPAPQTSNWVMLTIALALALAPLNLALRSLNEALTRARIHAAEADERGRRLESLVHERDAELNRRAAYLGATTAIATELSFIEYEAPQLLSRVVNIIAEQFGFYHVGLFLLDEKEGWAELRAASSPGGQRMLERGHRLRVGAEGIVGTVAGRGEVRVAQDVGRDAVFFNNPDLPETRAEAALPLRVRGLTIGVLDVQSTNPYAFSAEDVKVLQALADQVAMAIDSARLFQKVQERLTAERRTYVEQTRQMWQELLRARSHLSFASDANGIAPFMAWEPQMKAAAQTGQPVVSGDMPNVLAIPLRVREQVIGVIDGRKPNGAAWTNEEINLLKTLAEQLSTAIEGAQLYEDTQRRAAREQLAREITDKMRSTVSWDELMQTAIQEMAEAVGVSRSFVHWIPPQGTSSEVS
ncbi:MAG TPA: GAF domain-containing protein [Anaerolineae bacterium]|nr:GAF domain-containing protein [Anaerolineae bacterium]HQK13013.1 GAF domain-containing protein [Anaerolineae bacterium]